MVLVEYLVIPKRLDELPAQELKWAFRKAQRGKGLEKFTYYNGYYLLSVDGTDYFSSHQVHYEQFCEKHHREGKMTYYSNPI